MSGYVRSRIYIFNGFLFVGRCDPFFAFYGFLCVFFLSLLPLYVHCVFRSLSERAEGFPLRNTREDNSCRSFEVRGVAVILELLNVLHTLTPVL